MLSFVLKYRTAIDTVTADKSLKLRKYELDNEDWTIVGDLVSVLEVSREACNTSINIINVILAIQKGNSLFLPRLSQYRSCNSGHG